jgi:hypothetical protein
MYLLVPFRLICKKSLRSGLISFAMSVCVSIVCPNIPNRESLCVEIVLKFADIFRFS